MWCENNGIDYIFGLSGTRPLAKTTRLPTISARDGHRESDCSARLYRDAPQGQAWDRARRTVAHIRFVVISLDVGSAEWIYDRLYCVRGQAEDLIKLDKTRLASNRTSCRSALAKPVRLVLHTAVYRLMLTVRDAIPKVRELATAEFATCVIVS